MSSMSTKPNPVFPPDEFDRSLYIESLEEASFLYEQRLSLLDDPEISWKDIADFEERLEAHLDALVVGGEQALGICTERADEGDFGELHAAVCAYCRQDRMDLVLKILESLDPQNTERTRAVQDALYYELPATWQNRFIQLLPECRPQDIPMIAGTIGRHRLPAGKELLMALSGRKSEELSAVLWALGRLRCQELRQLPFGNYLSQQNESTCYAATLALLRMGDPTVLNFCMRAAESENWPVPLLGLCGSRSSIPLLHNRCSQDKASPDLLLALGMIGDISSVERLFAFLTVSDLAASSASALNLITGAEIYEEVFIPEEIDPDELSEEERVMIAQGRVPTRSDGKPYGATVMRLSQKQDDWNQWWTQNRARFKPEIRYRNGKPCSPACLLENLESEKSPRHIRQSAYEELAIRYGADFHLETDMRVAQQKMAIAKYEEWVQANGKRYREGAWYFAGQVIP